MIVRSMIAGMALLALAAGSSTALAEPPESKGPVKLTDKSYVDDKGSTFVISFAGTDTGKPVQAKAKDKNGKPLDVFEIPLKDVSVCVPKAGASSAAGAEKAKPLCQPIASVTDGSFLKMGTATCTCYVYGGIAYCYGDTCH